MLAVNESVRNATKIDLIHRYAECWAHHRSAKLNRQFVTRAFNLQQKILLDFTQVGGCERYLKMND